MLTPEHRRQIAKEIQSRRAARIVLGLPSNLPEPEEKQGQQPEEEEGEEEEEEGEQLPEPMKVADPEEAKAEQPASGFIMAEAEAEFAVVQATVMAEQHAILESIQNEVYVEANWQFLRLEQTATDVLFVELDTEIEEEDAGAKEPELQLPSMYPEAGQR